MAIDLINKAQQDETTKEFLLEQYKMYIEMADRISQRRASANSFFISANAAILAFATWLGIAGINILLISLAGLSISFFWFFSIRSYSQLNSSKYKVIHEIETKFPLRLYEYEWEVLGKGKSFKKYWPLSHIEKLIPFVFIALYIVLFILNYKR